MTDKMLTNEHQAASIAAHRQQRLTAAALVMGGMLIFGLAAAARSSLEPAGPGSESPQPSTGLDPNRAAWWQFARLPGIGPVLAERIVAERNRDDLRAAGAIRYRSPDDLLAIKGLGERKLRRIIRYLSFPDVETRGVTTRRTTSMVN